MKKVKKESKLCFVIFVRLAEKIIYGKISKAAQCRGLNAPKCRRSTVKIFVIFNLSAIETISASAKSMFASLYFRKTSAARR